jgi:hypothetical protein
MKRWIPILRMLAFLSSLWPVAGYPASLSLYDDFSGS